MVDRVYKSDIPHLRKSLERLRAEFSGINSSTDWAKLRLDPLIEHAKQLERRMKAQGSSRLRRGVPMFHSDLVYLRTNLRGLHEVLRSEQRAVERRIRRGSP